MKLRTLHIYGSTGLESDMCEACKVRAFVISGRMSCCGRPAPKQTWESLKVEVDTSNNRRRLPSIKVRRAILEKQKNCCAYCDHLLTEIHWDHLVPFVFNGNNMVFVASCPRCNRRKSAFHFSSIEEAGAFLDSKTHERKAIKTPKKKLPPVRGKFPAEASLAYLLR